MPRLRQAVALAATAASLALAAPAAHAASPRLAALRPPAAAIHPGEPLVVSVTLRNPGPRRAPATRLTFFASLDARLDARDVRLGGVRARGLPARDARRLRVQLRAPPRLGLGRHRLIACSERARRGRARARRRCKVAAGRLVVTARRVSQQPGQPILPTPGAQVQPVPPGDVPSSGTVAVGLCTPRLTVGALADEPAVVEGDAIAYSATVRNEPTGPCLGVEGSPTIAGSVDVSTTAAGGAGLLDVAMWIEVGDGPGHDVLPLAAGLGTSGASVPGACPGGIALGCTSAIQATVGNVAFDQGTMRSVAPGAPATVPFRFFPTLQPDDLARIAAAAPGGVRLVVALGFADGTTALGATAVDFATATTLNDVALEARLAGGAPQAIGLGVLAPGDQLDLPGAIAYPTSSGDPDTIESTFRATATDPVAVASEQETVTTVVTNDPADRPAVFPTAAPDAATVGTTPTVLVTASLRGEVDGDPTVVLADDGTELGTLNDDGLDGDIAAGDAIWSGRVAVPLTRSRELRVSALLDGFLEEGTVEVEALPSDAPTGPDAVTDPQTVADGQGEVLRDRIAIYMDEGAPYAQVEAAAQSVSGTVVARTAPDSWQIGIAPVATRSALDAVLAQVSLSAGVIGAEAIAVAQTSGVAPNDPQFANQDHLRQIQAKRAWIVNRGDASKIVIAILDTGVDRDHPDLQPRLLSGKDFGNGDNVPEDTCGHGTHVAGLAAAATNNGHDVAGVTWNASILPVKVFPDGAPGACGKTVHVAEAIRWAVDHGARVINMSFRLLSRDEDVAKALEYAWMADRVVVAAAGNFGTTTRVYPAAFERQETFSSWFGTFPRSYRMDVLAVGNVDGNDVRHSSSTHGGWVDVAAPGTNVLSTQLNQAPGRLTGTSMAAPVVAGLAALMLSREHTIPEVVRSRLVSTGRQINQDVGPRVDAFETVFNGSFEAGLATWRTTGTVTTVDRLGPITPRAGKRMLSLSTGPAGAQTQATVRKVLPIRSDAIEDGSIRFSLRYDYVTEEYPEFVGTQFNDDFTIRLLLPDGETRTLATESVNATAWTPVSGIDFPGGDATVGQSGWRTVSAQIPESALGGDGDLTLVVSDRGDAIYDSVALVDAIRIE